MHDDAIDILEGIAGLKLFRRQLEDIKHNEKQHPGVRERLNEKIASIEQSVELLKVDR